MKSIFLTLSAAVCFNLFLGLSAFAENYSLWPKRPPEIEQARLLVRDQKCDEALELLKPFTTVEGVVGREARKISAAVQIPKYLSRRNPHASVYTVRSGDTFHRIVNTTQCPTELVMLLNGTVDPSALQAGQRLAVIKMNLRAEVYPLKRELCVWDEDVIVASYDIEAHHLPSSSKNIETKVVMRDGMLDGSALPRRSTQYLAAERVLRLSGGVTISANRGQSNGNICLKSADVNELALLLSIGSEVVIVNE